MRANKVGAGVGAGIVGATLAAWAFIFTHKAFALDLEHEDVFPGEVAFAAVVAACLAGGAGALFGALAGSTLARLISRGKPPDSAS
jgi:hypothetical protein